MAMTKKDALRKWNKDNPDKVIAYKEGQGRLSREANAHLDKLAQDGWDIVGLTVSKPSTSTAAPVVTRTKVAGNKEVIEPMPYRYDEREWKARTGVPIFGATEFGMREACTNTGVSLVGCHACPDDQHRIHGVRVTLVRV